ncbi:unnamed protein product [Spodoptera littoralis]|uniref:Beta-1,4-N-acetylgalactosaminyltransferase n=1 Tax=Spodoptera littoralis TaxID=7109 RepID=A0A9P0N2E4_SPOLI|nr:unnamed protein product [Spodoptera littoralis]CAH1639053.1 unnamed protein product [Spodoptera littoralis]
MDFQSAMDHKEKRMGIHHLMIFAADQFQKKIRESFQNFCTRRKWVVLLSIILVFECYRNVVSNSNQLQSGNNKLNHTDKITQKFEFWKAGLLHFKYSFTNVHSSIGRERHSSLQECLDSVIENRRRRWRWKPCGVLICLTAALLYFAVTKQIDKIYYAKTQEQSNDKCNGPFNKGRLFNAGYKEMIKFNKFFCVIFHDLDLLPLNENIMYNCPTLPRHMCAHVNDTDIRRKFNITYSYKSLFGGVVSMTMEQFERANGFSNLYFGWGAEDNDMFWRLHAAGYPVVRYQKTVGVYLVLPHKREPANPYRHHLLSRAVERLR